MSWGSGTDWGYDVNVELPPFDLKPSDVLDEAGDTEPNGAHQRRRRDFSAFISYSNDGLVDSFADYTCTHVRTHCDLYSKMRVSSLYARYAREQQHANFPD